MWVKELGQTYTNAGSRGFGIRIAYAGDTVLFLVVQNDVRHIPELSAFFTDVFFDVEDRGWVFLYMDRRC